MRYKLVKFVNFDKALLTKNSEYFLASFANPSDFGPEVLVFPSDVAGNIVDWGEVDGGRGYKSLSEFITEKCTAL